MNTETRTHTALHVLKGAAQKVLNASLTTSVYVGGENGRLSIQFNRKPTDEEIVRIENEANNCIERNVEVKTLEMDRPEAEKRFGNIIYDNFSLPESITKLKILYIEDWNANCCIKEHTNTTGEVGKIKIDHWRFRESKQVLEISFKVY
jgi:alanyl-tRNA synthetase